MGGYLSVGTCTPPVISLAVVEWLDAHGHAEVGSTIQLARAQGPADELLQ